MPPPRRSRMLVAAGLKYSEQGLSRGKRALSRSSTDAPARASSSAVVAPAGPPPTTTASQRCVTPWPLAGRQVRSERAHHGAHHCGGEVHGVVVQPSPPSRQPYGLVAHGIAALETRVTRWALVLTLQGQYECPACDARFERGDTVCHEPVRLTRGWRWLDNDAVNLAATVVGAVVCALGPYLAPR